jgi:hypothetical protein
MLDKPSKKAVHNVVVQAFYHNPLAFFQEAASVA